MIPGTQAQQVQQLGLDEVADAVNRTKVGDMRHRRELMRLGMSDPSTFSSQFSSTLQQPNQQANIPGYQLGTQGYETQDLGLGKYNILGQDGQSIGTGYKSVSDTISDYLKQQSQTGVRYVDSPVMSYVNGVDPFVMWNQTGTNDAGQQLYSYGENTLTASEMEAQRQASMVEVGRNQGYQNPYQQQLYQSQQQAQDAAYQQLSNTLFSRADTPQEQWEALGQLLTTGSTSNQHGLYDWFKAKYGQELSGTDTYLKQQLLDNYYGRMPNNALAEGYYGNNQQEIIQGLNTLYGTQPVIQNGRLVGYSFNGELNPLQDSWNNNTNYYTGSGWAKAKHDYTDIGQAGIGRSYNDANWWRQNLQSMGDSYLIPTEVAASNPGWTNVDYYQRGADDIKSQSALHQALPIIAQTVASAINPAIGAAAGAMINKQQGGDWKSIVPGLVAAGLGASGGTDALGGAIDTATGVGTTAANMIASGLVNGVSTGVSTGDWGKAGLSGLTSGLGRGVGSWASDAARAMGAGEGLSQLFSGVAEGATRGLSDPKHMLESALASGVGRGIGGFMNEYSPNATPEQKRDNMRNAVMLSNLGRQLFRGTR